MVCDQLLVSQGDIQTLFGILNENLNEGATEEEKQIVISGGMESCSVTVSAFMELLIPVKYGHGPMQILCG